MQARFRAALVPLPALGNSASLDRLPLVLTHKRAANAVCSPPPCGEGLGVGVHADCSVNVLQHTLDILQHVIVPVAQHSIAIRFENARALGVRSRLRCMLTPINFDDHALGMAGEIDDVTRNLNLTAKMRASDSETMTQVPPQFALGFRGSASHLSRQLALRWRLCTITRCPDSRFVGGHDINSGCLPTFNPRGLGVWVFRNKHRLISRPPSPTLPHKGRGSRPRVLHVCASNWQVKAGILGEEVKL
jgi:hypothetical protein